MSRSMMNSLVCLSGIVVMSTVLISSYLFTTSGPARRSVHLIPNGKHLQNIRFDEDNRLFDVDKDNTRDADWMQEYVVPKRDFARRHRHPGRGAARKFELASSNSDDDDEDKNNGDYWDKTNDDYWDKNDDDLRRDLQKQEPIRLIHKDKETNNVKQILVDSRRYDDRQLSKLSQALSRDGKSALDNEDLAKEDLAKECQPLNSVAMIKTHKCSSSTLQNILLRKAEDLNLTVAIPKENVYFGSPNFFSRKFIYLDDGRKKYNIMASHMRFIRPRDVQEVMVPEAKYITIFRDPTKQFESIYTYYGWRSQFRADLHRFLQQPERYFHLFEPKKTRVAGRNPMCYDNGLDARHLSPGDKRINSFISILDGWYDLVLIAEYFDESLVLLKDLMCWTLDDVVYFSQNARNKDSVVPLSRGDQAAIRSWNWADQKLYAHFNRTLWEKIDAFGRDRMKRELELLALKKEALSQDCIGEVVKQGDKRMWYPNGIRVNSFIVNENAIRKHLCEQLTKPELVYLRKFRTEQAGSFWRQHPPL